VPYTRVRLMIIEYRLAEAAELESDRVTGATLSRRAQSLTDSASMAEDGLIESHRVTDATLSRRAQEPSCFILLAEYLWPSQYAPADP
jgi:hypothetical protein